MKCIGGSCQGSGLWCAGFWVCFGVLVFALVCFFPSKAKLSFFSAEPSECLFKQKLICLYDFDLQDDHKTPSKYLLCLTQNKSLITWFISSWYLPLTSPKINYDGCSETYLPKCLHSLLLRIIKTLTQRSSQVSALILSTNSHIKSIHHFSYLCFTAFYYRHCCWSSQAVPNHRQSGS